MRVVDGFMGIKVRKVWEMGEVNGLQLQEVGDFVE